MTGDVITALAAIGAVAVLGLGYYRARPYGRLGLFAWLQSVSLMFPWLVFFGLFATGIYLDLVGILFLLVGSTAAYVALGRQVRSLAQQQNSAQQDMAQRLQAIVMPDALPNADVAHNSTTPTPEALTEARAETLPVNPKGPSSSLETDVPLIEPMPNQDIAAIKGIFGLDSFFATETVPYQNGVIFNGNMRGEATVVHQDLSQRLRDRMDDRYRLFLIENPEGRPTIVVLPSRNDPQPSTPFQKFVSVVLGLATIATCLETAGFLLGFDFYQAPQRFREVLPIGLGLISILIAHELGHWFVARKYQIKLSWPFFLPTWQIGAFGALTRFESLLPDRKTLFDIAFAGPAAGGILSFVLIMTGLGLSHPGSAFPMPTQFFEGSVLVGTLAKAVLRDSLQQSIVDVNPLVIVGWIGLIYSALNLMPAGCLDGGRMVQAVYGRKIAQTTTIATLVLLAIVSLVNPLAMYWAILILFLQRTLERPSLNELTEPDDARAGLALVALFLMITVLLPLTPSLAGRLGIGG
jgi:Zn-dependent protease